MSDAEKAAAALSEGRSRRSLRYAWSAVRHGRSDELSQLSPIAAQLDEPALIAAVAVRRLQPRRSRVGDIVSSAVVYTSDG